MIAKANEPWTPRPFSHVSQGTFALLKAYLRDPVWQPLFLRTDAIRWPTFTLEFLSLQFLLDRTALLKVVVFSRVSARSSLLNFNLIKNFDEIKRLEKMKK